MAPVLTAARSIWILSLLVAGCVAPPLGVGAGPQSPRRSSHGVLEGRAALGAGPDRQAFQAEGSAMFRFARNFGLEAGAVYAQVAHKAAGQEVSVKGGFPYVRPRLIVGDVSLAVALSGGGMGGGGGGFFGGIADVQLGYAPAGWGVYAGAYRHGFDLTSEDPIETSSRQYRLGGQYVYPMGAARLGVALEAYHQDESLRNGGATIDARSFGGTLKLSMTSTEFR
ncbi:MAG: hypothetical protein IPL61_18270 [Myxococcales bacterium]|nr:hypothetical protein [Myxococcales bacterium]